MIDQGQDLPLVLLNGVCDSFEVLFERGAVMMCAGV